MYQDGVCRVTGSYYTKMVEFYDINYELLDTPEQAEILQEYSGLLSYFEPGVKFQLFLFNRKVDRETLVSRIDTPVQGDGFDSIRREFSQMLKGQMAMGNNGVIKSKYMLFGIEAGSYREARQRLAVIETGVIKNFHNIGAPAKAMDGKDRLCLLHEYFNQYSMEPFRFSYKDMVLAGLGVKDYVAPPGFDFRKPCSFKSGGMYGSVFYVDISAPKLDDSLLKRLLDIDSNITVTIHMGNVDPSGALKMIKEALSNVQKMKIDEQKKAVRSGYDMDIMPSDIAIYEKDTTGLLEDLNSSNQKIVNATFLVTCYGRTKSGLDRLAQRVSGIIQQANCNLRCLQYLQEQGLMASAPVGCNNSGVGRGITTKVAAVLVPFSTQELFMPAPAMYYGLNTLSNNMVLADRKKLRTPNGMVLGTPGSGKSFSAKREILGCFLMTDDDVAVCDPEGEYFPLVNALNGQVVRLATNSTDYLNPMDIQAGDIGDREALRLKSDFLITLCDMLAGGKNGLGNDEKGIIDQCIEKVYKGYFKNPLPENMPVLGNLYNELLRYEPGNMEKELAMEAKAKAVRIANSLVLYVHGSQNYFNHRTNVDSQNRIICFDIKELGNQLKELGMLVVQDAVWNRVSRNRERRVATRYYCDEFHLLLKEKQTALYSVEIWKRFRKWGGIPTGLTQNVTDFLKSPEVEGILGNSDFIYMLNQSAPDREILAEKLGLSGKQLGYVTGAEPGSGLIIFDNAVIPFTDRYPKDTLTYKIMNTKPEEAVQQEDIEKKAD